MLPWVCSVIDHRRRQNVVRTSVTHSAIASCATILFLPHFDVICDLLLNRRTATWNLFVNYHFCEAPRADFDRLNNHTAPSLRNSFIRRDSDQTRYHLRNSAKDLTLPKEKF